MLEQVRSLAVLLTLHIYPHLNLIVSFLTQRMIAPVVLIEALRARTGEIAVMRERQQCLSFDLVTK
jgi:hypothetical protein